MSCAIEELNEIYLGDKYLNKRTHRIVENLFDNASRSILTACGGGRISQHIVVLCLHDTTELDFTDQAIGGMGRLSYDNQRGLYPAFEVDGSAFSEVLGVTDFWMWVRGTIKDQEQPSICEFSLLTVPLGTGLEN